MNVDVGKERETINEDTKDINNKESRESNN
jgi:hypothetical protein